MLFPFFLIFTIVPATGHPPLLAITCKLFWVYAGLLLTGLIVSVFQGAGQAVGESWYILLILPKLAWVFFMLLGSWLIWQQKRTGYFIFIASWLFAFVYPFLSGSNEVGIQEWMAVVFPVFFTLSYRHLK